MNKLLGQRKKFNLELSSSASSDFDDLRKSPEPILSRFNISLVVADDGSLRLNHSHITTDFGALDTESDFGQDPIVELPKVKKPPRSHSQRSNKSTRSLTTARNSHFLDVSTSSDDEAFMNNDDNFQKSPRPLRRSLRKRKTSSLKRRKPVQTVPEIPVISTSSSPAPLKFEDAAIVTVTALDDTVEETGDLSLQWIENNNYYSTDPASSENGDCGCPVISERSLLIANAETEDALSESDYNPADDGRDVFKMPYPVSYRPNLSKRKLVIESDEEFISKTYRAPIKRSCIRYYL